MDGPVEATLVTRRGCHLCAIALALLEAAARDIPLCIRVADVDSDPDMLAAYDWRVPVVLVGGRPVAEGVFTPLQLREALLAGVRG